MKDHTSDQGHTARELHLWLTEEMDRDSDHKLGEIIWDLSARLEDDLEFQREIERCRQLTDSSPPKISFWRGLSDSWEGLIGTAGKLAAGALVTALIAGIAYLQLSQSTPLYRTEIGEQQFVTLEDGSTISLNTNTELRIEFDDFTRRIDMIRGEAIFTVARNPARPFEVHAGQGVTRALGTAFNVFMDRDRIAVAVLEGKVEVNTKTSASRPPVQLDEGKGVNYFSGGGITQAYNADLRRIHAWEDKKLFFEDTRLADIVAEYNRYSKKRLVLGSDDLEDLAVSGVFRIGNLNSLLFTLEQVFSIKPVEQGEQIVLVKQTKTKAPPPTL